MHHHRGFVQWFILTTGTNGPITVTEAWNRPASAQQKTHTQLVTNF